MLLWKGEKSVEKGTWKQRLPIGLFMAVLGAKAAGLPVFATVVFDQKGKMLTGADVETVCALLESLRVDAIGFNCGLGPVQMEGLRS